MEQSVNLEDHGEDFVGAGRVKNTEFHYVHFEKKENIINQNVDVEDLEEAPPPPPPPKPKVHTHIVSVPVTTVTYKQVPVHTITYKTVPITHTTY